MYTHGDISRFKIPHYWIAYPYISEPKKKKMREKEKWKNERIEEELRMFNSMISANKIICVCFC